MKRKCWSLFFVAIFLVFSANSSFAQYKFLLPDNPTVGNERWNAKTDEEIKSFVLKLLEKNLLEELTNPTLSSPEYREKRAEECSKIDSSLGQIIYTLRSDPRRSKKPGFSATLSSVISLKELTMTYLLFAKEWPDELVNYIYPESKKNGIALKIPRLKQPKDRRCVVDSIKESYESIIKKWRLLGLEVPAGYIYVKVFPSSEELQDFLQKKSTSEDDTTIGGITFPCRFIAVPWDGEKAEFKNALEHEFTHAFVNTTIGFFKQINLPGWWHEGLATFLSDDLGSHLLKYKMTSDTDGNLVSHTLESRTNKEYMEFKGRFEYILSIYGEKKFISFISRAMESGHTGNAFREVLDIHDEDKFFMEAKKWKETWNFRGLSIALCI